VEIDAAQGGQNADQRHPALMLGGRMCDPVQQQAKLGPQNREWPAGQWGRGGVQLQVEPVQLHGDAGIASHSADGLVQRQGPGCGVDQEQLQLSAQGDRTHAEARPPQ
jgi:hypothetical protein